MEGAEERAGECREWEDQEPIWSSEESEREPSCTTIKPCIDFLKTVTRLTSSNNMVPD